MIIVVTFMAGNTEAISTKIRQEEAAVQTSADDNELVVTIDAGHGGIDPGKVGVNDSLEKDINLAIAQKVKVILEKNNIKVYLTREEDKGLYNDSDKNKKVSDLGKRCSLIDGWGSDIAVSIHQNSYSDASVSGGQVFYYAASEEGEKLAQDIQLELSQICKKIRPVKGNKEYYLLLNVKCPIVIVECGFLSNHEEAALLITDEYQQRIAEAVSAGIVAYLDKKQ
ncbi:MAG: N-acetylmuramoyl-L-alanine amidase [Lachnospiraceae bacterium]|nr:N-acetylmuramoyl-L-alanine amidase [Lachnospiraceae bacterium]